MSEHEQLTPEEQVKILNKRIRELEKFLDEKSPEAIYSSTFKVKRGSITKMVTVRGRPGEDWESFHFREDAVLESLGESGWQGIEDNGGRTISATVPRAGAAPARPSAPLGDDAEPYSFPATTLLAGSIKNGKVFWKIKGGRWEKWGVTVYPEILAAAGFDVEGLDASKEYSLNGFTAYFLAKADGTPIKVTRLERP